MDQKGLPERCRGCIHSAELYPWMEGEPMRACLYILDRYEPRGCPADEKCVRYEPGQRRKEWYLEPLFCE